MITVRRISGYLGSTAIKEICLSLGCQGGLLRKGICVEDEQELACFCQREGNPWRLDPTEFIHLPLLSASALTARRTLQPRFRLASGFQQELCLFCTKEV